MDKPTPAEVEEIRRTMADARAGHASLAKIAAARDLCLRAGLPGCAEELRIHALRKLDADKPAPRSAGRDVVLGVATGALTHYLMKGL